MDDIVYQCPECNFNAEDLTELDVHLLEYHSNTGNSGLKNSDDYNYNDEYALEDEEEADIIIENEIPATFNQVLKFKFMILLNYISLLLF